jgi:hypothetical protein
VAAATVAAGLYLRRATDTPIGVPWPPALGAWGPRADPWLAVTITTFAAALALAPRLLTLRPAAFAAATLPLTLALRLALAPARSGPTAWYEVFDPARSAEAKNEYLPALGALDAGVRFFLDRFAELVPSLPVHAAGHPPGLLVVLHVTGIATPGAMAALCIGAGALSGPLSYLLAREVLDDAQARMAALLLAFAPGALLFGATSADALYLTLGLLAAGPLVSRRRGAQTAGAVLLALASLFAWSLLAVAAWAAILVALRDGPRRAAGLAALTGAALLAVHGALAAATGWDPVGTLRATHEVYRLGIASQRPYAYWLFGSPVAFLLVLGLPIAWLALTALARRRPEAIAIFAVIAIASILGVTKAETERIWLFLAPFVCLAAAPLTTRPRAVLAALAAQAVAYELLFETLW